MSITYTYEIVTVDEQARCMEVIYRADGYPEYRISARLPYEGESLEAVIHMFSPVPHWIALRTPVVVPQVGATGVIAPVVEAPPAPAAPEESPVIDSVIQNF